jgi:hypothetical protein
VTRTTPASKRVARNEDDAGVEAGRAQVEKELPPIHHAEGGQEQ